MTSRQIETSDLDGEEWGGFIVVNLEAPMRNPYQVLEDDRGETFFHSLSRARRVCERLRRENHNGRIYVYAVAGVQDALMAHPSSFAVA